MAGNVAVVDLLLKNGANITETEIIELLSDLANEEGMIKCLINNGVDLNVVDSGGLTLLHLAVKKGMSNKIDQLWQFQVLALNFIVRFCALLIFWIEWKLKILIFFLAKQAVTALLLKNGFDVNARTKKNETPLDFATYGYGWLFKYCLVNFY